MCIRDSIYILINLFAVYPGDYGLLPLGISRSFILLTAAGQKAESQNRHEK